MINKFSSGYNMPDNCFSTPYDNERCPVCERVGVELIEINDDEYVCEYCIDDYAQCEHCDHYTQDELYEVESNGKSIYVCEECLHEVFTDECEVCSMALNEEDTIKEHRCRKHTSKLDIMIQTLKNKIYLIKRRLK